MNVETNLQGRLRNTFLPLSHGLAPLFEAVVNSIHSIEDSDLPPEAGRIRVHVERTPSQGLLSDKPDKREWQKGDIGAFAVTDNGVGFTDENFEAFVTLDTDHKAARGGRGIGRLLWLKAFQKAEITSRFRDGDTLRERSIRFDATGLKSSVKAAPKDSPRETVVRLVGFGARYRSQTRKTVEAIARALLEHCLWYFVRVGGAPKITVDDGEESVSLDQLFDTLMPTEANREQIKIKTTTFDLLHVRLRTSSGQPHSIAYCADNRLVLEEKLSGRVAGLHGRLQDESGEFVYICYLSSPLLDERVRPERSGFDLPTEVGDLFEGTDIGWDDIKSMVAERASKQLAPYLEEVKRRAAERVQHFVAHRAPRYRPILSRMSPDDLNIDPDISDRDLELKLHGYLADLEQKLVSQGHALMVPRIEESQSQYRHRLDEYLQTAEDIKKSDLANYVAHRKVVLDLLSAAIQRLPDGSYAREDLIHALIMPMRTDSNDGMPDDANLWLIDERLAFHDYLASDKTLASIPVTGSKATKEPDIFALNVFDNPMLVAEGTSLPLASITVVELKRPMRNDAGPGETDDPIEQALSYLERVREGKVRTVTGRPIPNSESIPGFCYVICDLTPSIEQRCKIHGLKRTSDNMGFFGFNDNYKAYVEVISFDRLVNSAKERNRAFFDKLGLPSN